MQHSIAIDPEDRLATKSSTASLPSLGEVSVTGSRSSRTNKRLSIDAEFHKVSHKKSDRDHLHGRRASLAKVLEHDNSVNFMAVLIFVDFICTLVDVDARAAGQNPPLWTWIIEELCLIVYTVEIAVVFYVHRIAALRNKSVLFDVFCVLSGFLAAFVRHFGSAFPGELKFLYDLKVMRVVRILRVARIIRKTRSLRELQKLMAMMSTCLKALGWSFIFCFAFMTLWAMLLVEFVHPLMEQMYRDGLAFGDCKDCTVAASSVMRAVLLLFKTVIAGDSWGRIAVPVIEYYPATAIIFCGSLLTLVFGVLNMVVAVVVDSFAEGRQKDLLHLAEELEHENREDKKHLEAIFNRLDIKEQGDLTLQELIDGAKNDLDFQSRLRVMDIDQADLEQLFEMIDADMSGSISKDEFVGPLSRWIVDSKTAPRFVKYNVDRVLHQQEEILKQHQQQFLLLSQRLDELCEHLLPHNSLGCESLGGSGGEAPMFGLEVGIEQPKESSLESSLLWSQVTGKLSQGSRQAETWRGPVGDVQPLNAI